MVGRGLRGRSRVPLRGRVGVPVVREHDDVPLAAGYHIEDLPEARAGLGRPLGADSRPRHVVATRREVDDVGRPIAG